MTRPIDDVSKDKAAAEAALADFLAAHPDPYQDPVQKMDLEGLIRRREIATDEWVKHPAHARPGRTGPEGQEVKTIHLRAAPRVAIRLEGEIDGLASDELATALADHEGQDVLLVINSPGGLATEGAAMAAEIERHGRVQALGQGIVASAATLPFLAAKRATLHSAAVFMIHDPAALAIGNAEAMRKWADDLDKIGGVYADFYARQTGHPVERVRSWMAAETWLSAEDAIALNFADAIEERREAEAVACFDYTAFRHAPDHLVRMTADNGWAAVPPAAA